VGEATHGDLFANPADSDRDIGRAPTSLPARARTWAGDLRACRGAGALPSTPSSRWSACGQRGCVVRDESAAEQGNALALTRAMMMHRYSGTGDGARRGGASKTSKLVEAVGVEGRGLYRARYRYEPPREITAIDPCPRECSLMNYELSAIKHGVCSSLFARVVAHLLSNCFQLESLSREASHCSRILASIITPDELRQLSKSICRLINGPILSTSVCGAVLDAE